MSRSRRRNHGRRVVSCGICGSPVAYERLNEHRASCSPRRREARAPEPRQEMLTGHDEEDDVSTEED